MQPPFDVRGLATFTYMHALRGHGEGSEGRITETREVERFSRSERGSCMCAGGGPWIDEGKVSGVAIG